MNRLQSLAITLVRDNRYTSRQQFDDIVEYRVAIGKTVFIVTEFSDGTMIAENSLCCV